MKHLLSHQEQTISLLPTRESVKAIFGKDISIKMLSKFINIYFSGVTIYLRNVTTHFVSIMMETYKCIKVSE